MWLWILLAVWLFVATLVMAMMRVAAIADERLAAERLVREHERHVAGEAASPAHPTGRFTRDPAGSGSGEVAGIDVATEPLESR